MVGKKLVISLDFDGVIADCGELKRQIASEISGKPVELEHMSSDRVRAGQTPLTLEEWNNVREKVYFDPTSIERMQPVEGSIIAINAWLDEGHLVKVVTARMGQMREDAVRWLMSHGIDIPVIGAGSRMTKVPHLEGSDIFVDDDPNHVTEASAICAAYFFKWPYNDAPEDINSITSLAQITIDR